MKERRTRDAITWSRFFWCTVLVLLWCVVFTGFAFFSFRPLFAAGRFRPELESGRGRGGDRINAVGWDPHRHAASRRPTITVRGTVVLPDEIQEN